MTPTNAKTLHPLRWTLGALAGLLLAACAQTATDQEVASAQAPQPLEAKQAPPADAPPPRGDGENRDRPDPKKIIERHDTNKNGTLELAELPERMREHLAEADLDKNGALSVEELEKHRPPIKHGRGHRDPAKMIEHLDANKNGALELSELPDEKRERLAGADTDKNGALSPEELEAHFEAHHHEGRPPQ
jgi:hypothetical protein